MYLISYHLLCNTVCSIVSRAMTIGAGDLNLPDICWSTLLVAIRDQ